MTAYKWAERYAALGWSVVPVKHGTKKPALGEWKRLQTERCTPEELTEWFQGDIGIGTVCGAVSGSLVVLDFDDADSYQRFCLVAPPDWESAPVAQTSRGYHVYLRARSAVSSGRLTLPGESDACGDILAEGKFVVLPPTLGTNGEPRTWLREPQGELPWAEPYLEAYRGERGAQADAFRHVQSLPVGMAYTGPILREGERNQGLFQFGCRLRGASLSEAEIGRHLLETNGLFCDPPLEQREVESITRSVGRFPAGRHSLRNNTYDDEPRSGVASRPEVGLREGTKPGLSFTRADRFLEETEGIEEQWLVSDFLPEGYLVVLGATSKAGKSSIVTNLAANVARGEPFLGMETVPGPVLWLAYEESEAERRLALVRYDLSEIPFYVSFEKPLIDTREGMERIAGAVAECGAKLLVIDPLYGACGAESLSDGRTARNALQGLKELCRTHGCTAIVLHHFNKNVGAGSTRERQADSGQILATASMDICMDSRDVGSDEREIRLHCTGRGAFANRSMVVRSGHMSDFRLLASGSAVEVNRKATEATVIEAVRNSMPEGLTAEELAERLDCNLKTLRNQLTAMTKAGLLVRAGTRDRASVYELPTHGEVSLI